MAPLHTTRRAWLATTAAALTAAPASADPLAWTLTQAAAALANRTISSEELTKLCLARVAKLDKSLNAFITLQADTALAQARQCDRERKTGPLHGIPLALKDNIDTAGVRTTAAARVFQDRVPTE